jgi:hypothetical protein
MSLTVQASSQPSSRLRDQNLGELRYPHGSDCWVRYGSNNSGQNGGTNEDKGKDCNYLGSGDYSPEKAGVGGSTPSLATIIPKNLAKSGGRKLAKITHAPPLAPEGEQPLVARHRVCGFTQRSCLHGGFNLYEWQGRTCSHWFSSLFFGPVAPPKERYPEFSANLPEPDV